MALSDEQEKELRSELDKEKEKLKKLEGERDELRSKIPVEKPKTGAVDPDIAKSIAEMQKKISDLESRLGVPYMRKRFNLFE